MSGGAQQLVTMANDIANFFASESDPQVAVDGVVRHIVLYWEPRMRAKIVAHLNVQGGAGLNALARAAVVKLAAVHASADP